MNLAENRLRWSHIHGKRHLVAWLRAFFEQSRVIGV